MAITYFVVVPFGRSEEGDLVPMEPMEAPNGESARRRASAAAKNAGAIAFSRIGDPNTGDFGDAVILATYGEVDHGMLGEWEAVWNQRSTETRRGQLPRLGLEAARAVEARSPQPRDSPMADR